MRVTLLVIGTVVFSACLSPPNLDGAPCPCTEGWVCAQPEGVCVRAGTPCGIPNIVSHWRLDETEWVGAGAVRDSIGAAHGDATSDVEANFSGIADSAARFSVPGAHLVLPDDDAANDGSFTAGLWMYLDAEAVPSQSLIDSDSNEATSGGFFSLAVLGSSVGLTHRGELVSGPPVGLGAWVFVVGSYDEGTRRLSLFIDGEPVVQEILPSGAAVESRAPSLCVGGQSGSGGCIPGMQFNGGLDEIWTASRALSSEEIGCVYSAGASRPP